MKQKLIGSTLYVFQVEPYQITEDASEATTIKVQEESYPGFVELNTTLEDKLVKYNYKVVCITQQEWMPYIDEPDPVVENYTFTLYPGAERRKVIVNFSDGQAREATVDDSHMPGMNDPISIEGYGQYEGLVYTYAVPENIEITLVPTEWIGYYSYDHEVFSYDDETHSLTPSIVMDADKAVYFIYAPKQDPELAWSAEYAIVTLGADDNVFPTLDNPHNVSPITYSSDKPGVAAVDEYGTVTLSATGTAAISAIFEGDATYDYREVSYNLIVQEPQPQGHTLYLTGDCDSTYIGLVEIGGDEPGILSEYSDVQAGSVINIGTDSEYPAGSKNWTITRSDGGTIELDYGMYTLEMPNSDLTVNFDWTGVYDLYTFILAGSNIYSYSTIKINGETRSYGDPDLEYGVKLDDGDVIDVYPTRNVANYTLVRGATWDTDHWTATINGADVTIEINYIG